MCMNKKWIQSALSLAVLSVLVSTTQAQDANQVYSEAKLKSIVVTASGSEVDVKDAPASISVISNEDIERAPFNSIAELLSDLPGVTGGYSNSGSGSKIKLRGMPDKYTLILVDGKRLGNQSLLGHRPDRTEQDLDWITPDMIERIEVIRGSMSTLYGSEAVGGVINIITKKIPTQLSGSVTTNFSKPDTSRRGETKSFGATLAGPVTNTIGFRLGLNRTERDGDKDTEGSSGSTTDTATTRLTWAPSDRHSFNLDGSFGKDEPDVIEGGGSKFGYEMDRIGFGIGHEAKFENDLVTNVDLYHNKIQNKDDAWVKDDIVETKSSETVLDLKATKPLNVFNFKNDLTIGGQYKQEEVSNHSNIGNAAVDKDGNTLNNNDRKLDSYSWSLFLEDQIHLQENLILTLGGRLDEYETFDLNFSPRTYLVYHPTDDWTVKGGVSRSFRAPNLRERSDTSSTGSRGNGCNTFEGWSTAGSGRTCSMIGNPDLEPETSTNYEVSVGYEQNGAGLDMTYFLSDIEDLIQNRFHERRGDVFYAIASNVEKARTSGIEVNYKLPINDYFRVTGNTTYMLESKNKITGETLLGTPEITSNLALVWDVNDQLSLNSKVQYLGKQQLESGDSSRSFEKAYTTADIGANYNFTDHLTFRGGVKNVAGVKIESTSDGSSNPAEYYLGLTARF